MENNGKMIEGLTAYATQRQIGFENHPYPGERQPEVRNEWIRGMLLGMASSPEDAQKHIEQFDCRLRRAAGCFAVEPASRKVQRETVDGLRRYITELEAAQADPRGQLIPVQELLEDMAAWLPWAGGDIGLDTARDQVESAILHTTLRQPLRFTRVVIGGEWGPYESGFVPGVMKTAAEIMATELYRDFAALHPEKKEWPSLCTVYTCGPGLVFRDASPLDLEIMNREGDRILDYRGVQFAGGPYQHTLKEAAPAMTMKFR